VVGFVFQLCYTGQPIFFGIVLLFFEYVSPPVIEVLLDIQPHSPSFSYAVRQMLSTKSAHRVRSASTATEPVFDPMATSIPLSLTGLSYRHSQPDGRHDTHTSLGSDVLATDSDIANILLKDGQVTFHETPSTDARRVQTHQRTFGPQTSCVMADDLNNL
jgi:hypothetical protein